MVIGERVDEIPTQTGVPRLFEGAVISRGTFDNKGHIKWGPDVWKNMDIVKDQLRRRVLGPAYYP